MELAERARARVKDEKRRRQQKAQHLVAHIPCYYLFTASPETEGQTPGFQAARIQDAPRHPLPSSSGEKRTKVVKEMLHM